MAPSFLPSIGIIWLFLTLFKLLSFVWLYIRPSSIDRYNYTKEGSRPWALITGASDGLGRAFAHVLASQGFNIFLHGRDLGKLESVKESILSQSPRCMIDIIIAQAAVNGPELIERIYEIADDLKETHLTVLINNVGGHPPGIDPIYRTFDNHSSSDIDNSLAMNLRFPIQLTAALLPHLLASPGPKLIINIGSLTDVGAPWLCIYASAKAALMSWSAGLAKELKVHGKNIEVLGIVPAAMRKKRQGWDTPDFTTFAKAALGKVGCGIHVVQGYWGHGVLKVILGVMPQTLSDLIMVNGIASAKSELESNKKKN